MGLALVLPYVGSLHASQSYRSGEESIYCFPYDVRIKVETARDHTDASYLQALLQFT